MAYTINLTNGTTLVPGGLSDGTIDTTHSSLTLIGRDYAGYGQFLNENFVYLLENFANSTGPGSPLKGQLWWDTTNNVLRVWTGVSWKISTGSTSSPASSPPGDLSSLGGDLWFDSTNQQLKVYSGTSWVVVGPTSTPATGVTGALATLMSDTSSGTHVVVQFTINGTVYAILSKDAFNSTLTGFSSIIAGLNFNTTAVPTLGLNTQNSSNTPNTLVLRDGTGSFSAQNITAVGTITAGTITAGSITPPAGQSSTFTGNLIGNVTAINVTAQTISTQGINSINGFTGLILTPVQPNITTLTGLTSVAITGTATYNGSQIATVGGSASFSSINSTPIGNATPSTGAFTTLTVATSLVPTANAVVNLGGSTAWWNNIYGTAVHAQYADLAERFAADAEYLPGTVVEIGGNAEITKVDKELSEKVFGVISTNAAYLMNSSAGENSTHPPVAMSGRVPVRVTGFINKGDRLVSAGNGIARAGLASEISPWNVIGRSLVDKSDSELGIIEAIVKINS